MMFSIVIPTYEYGGKACEMLEDCLKSIESQTFQDYEIIVTDHSKDDVIKDYLCKWNLPIKYYKNDRGVGNSSINMNEGILKSNGKYIKIMHMDDWFCNVRTLEIISDAIDKNPDKKWGGVSFNHYYQNQSLITRFIQAHVNEDIKTLLGCPSVSFFINDKDNLNLFDENLVIINDSDMHIRLGKKYGNPILISTFCVTVRMHDMQVSNNVTSQKHQWEINYYKRKNFV